MAALLSSKVVVVEEEPRVRGIAASASSVAGMVGVTQSGPVAQAVCCTSLSEFEAVFGGLTKDSAVALAAMGFFENGGVQLWVVRTVHFEDVGRPETATSKAAIGELLSGQEVILAIHGKTPGAYGNQLSVEVRAPANGESDAFDLLVIEDGVHRERFSNISLTKGHERHAENIVNDAKTGSALIRVAQTNAPVLVPDLQTIQLSGGDDGLAGLDDNDFIGSEIGKTGLHALDAIQDLSLILVPGKSGAAIHGAMIDYCESTRTGLAFAILDPPDNQSAVEIVDYVVSEAALYGRSEHAAIYWPRVQILNPAKSVFGAADKITVAPSGIVAGVFARTAAARPGGIYDPPAGIEKGILKGVLGFERDEVLEEKKRDLVYPKRINPLTTGPGLPRFIDGARTLKGDGNFPYVAERLGVSFIEKSLKSGLQFARHKNNTEALRAQVRRTITAFLLAQLKNGAFQSSEAEKAFFVDVSDALNSPTIINFGQLIVRIGLATNKPAEFIILKISQDTRAIESEIAG